MYENGELSAQGERDGCDIDLIIPPDGNSVRTLIRGDRELVCSGTGTDARMAISKEDRWTERKEQAKIQVARTLQSTAVVTL